MRSRWTDPTVALALGLLVAALSWGGVLTPLEEAFYDQVSPRLPPRGEPPPVVVVGIDEPSLADLGVPWPWPRQVHARLVHALRDAGATRIGYDILFAEQGDPTQDRLLAEALKSDVVLAGDTAVIDRAHGTTRMEILPFPLLTENGAAVGNISVPLDADGAVRRLPDVPGSMAIVLADPVEAPPDGARMRFRHEGLEHVSFYQALDPTTMLPPGTFDGKVVLVGIALRSGMELGVESFRTPETALGRGFTPGVVLHAQAYRSIASGDWIVPLPRWVPPILAVAAALMAAFLSQARAAGSAGFATLGLAALAPAISTLFLAIGSWLPPIAATLGALLGGGGQIALGYGREFRARREITRMFGHYVAPEIVERLASSPDALNLGGERRLVTILFCDLRGFTSLSERMRDQPEVLTRTLNEALGVVADAVMDNGGLVDKFIGDCVMGLWNAPISDPDHADHAIAAGRQAIAGMDALAERLLAEGFPVRLACGVGINSGECTIGNMGSARRLDYTAVGDPVNLASRLESMTKEYGVQMLVGSETARLARRSELAFVGEAEVRGRVMPEQLFTGSEMLRNSTRLGRD